MCRPLAVILSLVSIAQAFSATQITQLDTSHRLIISIHDQKLDRTPSASGSSTAWAILEVE